MDNNRNFKFEDLSKEEKEERGILGRLYGPCAAIAIPTRNGRVYSSSLWEKVFSKGDTIINEMFGNGGLPMELDHPSDRSETCSDRIAAMMPQAPVRDGKDHLQCCVDIIDTPCGRIAYQLAKYGFNLGISSRGNGDLETDYDGNESVNPDTYDFQTFDLVLLPAVKEARLKLMTESLGGKTFKQSIKESLEKATPEEKKVMEETLDELNIDYKTVSEEIAPIDNGVQEKEEAEDNGSDMSNELLEALKANEDLRKQMSELQEKLSVSYTKEAELVEKVSKYQGVVRGLSTTASLVEGLKESKGSLEKSVEEKDKLLKSKDEEIAHLKEEVSKIRERARTILTESKRSEKELSSLKESLNSERRKNISESKEKNKMCEELQRKINDLQGDIEIKTKEYNAKVSKSNNLVEKYKNIAQTAVDRYISSQALRIGVKPQEIKNKLGNSYTFDEVDSICEDLQRYKINVSKLPFSINEESRVKVKKAEEPIAPSNPDDLVDEELLRLAKLKT